MTQDTNRQIVLAARPVGAPKDGDFRLVEAARPEPGAGEMLCRTVYLSLDPYMRGRMNATKSYAASAEIEPFANRHIPTTESDCSAYTTR